MSVQLIVGLGNPGEKYANTRHNAGVWFINALARAYKSELRLEKKFLGAIASAQIGHTSLRFLVPSTYMNESGRAVAAVANFYRIDSANILVAHDELDLSPGIVRLKNGGGLAGHNGLKDISRALGGAKDYHRLRIGIGHPGAANAVTNYVLKPPSVNDRALIDDGLSKALAVMPSIVIEDWEPAMLSLHTRQNQKEKVSSSD